VINQQALTQEMWRLIYTTLMLWCTICSLDL